MKKDVILVVLIVLVLGLGGYLLFDKVLSNNQTEEKEEKNNQTNDQNENLENSDNNQNINADLENDSIELKSYNVDEIKNIEISMPVKDSPDLEMKVVIIENKKEMEEILLNVDEPKEKEPVPYGMGFESNTVITVNYDGDPSTVIIILGNGDVVINNAVGVGETGYTKYEISNKNFEKELLDKYQK